MICIVVRGEQHKFSRGVDLYNHPLTVDNIDNESPNAMKIRKYWFESNVNRFKAEKYWLGTLKSSPNMLKK